MKLILKTLVFAALFAGTAMAQSRVMSGVTWNIGLATGNLSRFLSEPSFGGMAFEARNFVSDNFSYGGSISWNYWSEKTGAIIELKQGALSGTQIRYVNSLPLLVNAHYYIGDKHDAIRPFLGVNVGAYWIRQRLDMGIYTLDNDHWHFGLSPEAGILLQVDRDTYIGATGRYNYAFASGETLSGAKNTVAYWGINVGAYWTPSWF